MATFALGGWRVTSVKGPIAAMGESDRIAAELGFPHPTMMFPRNSVRIEKEDGSVAIAVDAQAAVGRIAKTSPAGIKIVHSSEGYWQEKQRMFKQELDYDWTYFSPYGGDLVHGTAAATPLQIDYKRLRPTPGQEIRFFDENVLFEDEMGDNGSATFLVKTRVMEFGIFMLVQSFIRVDNVIFKAVETRYSVDFGTGCILQEIRHRQEPFSTVFARLGRVNVYDNALVAEQLQVVSTATSQITYPVP